MLTLWRLAESGQSRSLAWHCQRQENCTDAHSKDYRITIECSRVPCVGEKIMLDYLDGGAAPYTVEYVSWTVYRNNSKPVDAMISIDLNS